MEWVQNYDPLGSAIWSPLTAGLPIFVLLGLLIAGVPAPQAALAGLITALVVAIGVFKMPLIPALAAAGCGGCFGLLPIGWIVLNAVFLYHLTVRTGQFDIVKRSVTAVSPDQRMQALLIAFSFGSFLEGTAGFGTPVAISAALLIGLGFSPLYAAALALLANTSPVAFGGLGRPIMTLAKVSGLNEFALGQMAGRQLTSFSLIIPAWLAVMIIAAAGDQIFADQQPDAESPRPLSQSVVGDYGVREIVFAMRPRSKDPHWYANFGYYADRDTRLPYGNGGKLCRLDLATGTVVTLLEDKEGTVRDPVVHYDAEKILFSYRKGGTSFHHLYEINLDGGHLRQLTDGPFDDIEPCYLPDGSIVFISNRCKRWVNCWLTQVANMHRCDADGRNIRQISANCEQDNTPWPLPDGRVLYQRWEYVDRSQVHYHHLWTVNPDGTAEMVYFGNLNPGTVMIDAKPIPQTNKVVAIFSAGHGQKDHDGAITVIDAHKGPDEQNFARPVVKENDYRDPWAFSEKLFLAARRKRIVLLDDAGHAEEVYRVNDEDAAAGLECHEPRPIVRRQRERVVPDRTNPQLETGTLVLMDVYKGRNMTGVQRCLLYTSPSPRDS